jgi:anti-sigma factor RsiW
MKCITSPALENVEIARYVDGEADEAVVVHIQQCPFCSERARQWTLLQNRLKKQFYRVNCPTPMQLGDYHLGLLPAPQALVISGHLRECLLCKREVAVLEDFLNSLAPESGLFGAAKVLVARLMGSQAENGLAPALRGEAKGPLTFEADGIVIVLDIQPTKEGKASIFGQVAADDQDQWTGALVELRKDDQLQASTEVDDLGTFQYTSVTPGGQELRIWPQAGPVVIVPNF